jgi:uncharacterized membrane protein
VAFSQALAISADGSTVVGIGTGPGGQRPFRWTSTTGMQELGILAASTTGRANGVSADGMVVVGRSGDRSVRWLGPAAEDLNTFGDGSISSANGLSRDGSIVVGNAFNGDFSLPDTVPYRWTSAAGTQNLGAGRVTPGNFEAYGAMDASLDGSVIVGNEGILAYAAFRWTSAGGLVYLPHLPFGPQLPAAAAKACTDDAAVIVGWSISVPGRQACRWDNTVVEGLGDLAGGTFESEALGVGHAGAVVVGRGTTDSGSEAFYWDASGMRRLAEELGARGISGFESWTLRAATGISRDGLTITGWGINPNGDTEAWIVQLPDPETCYPNCDGSSSGPILAIEDFVCFRSRFAAGESYANCDGSTTPPVLNIQDFICFMNQFVAGCG